MTSVNLYRNFTTFYRIFRPVGFQAKPTWFPALGIDTNWCQKAWESGTRLRTRVALDHALFGTCAPLLHCSYERARTHGSWKMLPFALLSAAVFGATALSPIIICECQLACTLPSCLHAYFVCTSIPFCLHLCSTSFFLPLNAVRRYCLIETCWWSDSEIAVKISL